MAVVVVIWLALFSITALANPEQGKWTFDLDKDKPYLMVTKHMYKDSKVAVSVNLTCEGDGDEYIEISWMMRTMMCPFDISPILDKKPTPDTFLKHLMMYPIMMSDNNTAVEYTFGSFNHSCAHFSLTWDTNQKVIKWPPAQAAPNNQSSTSGKDPDPSSEEDSAPAKTPLAPKGDSSDDKTGAKQENNPPAARKKRDDGTKVTPAPAAAAAAVTPTKPIGKARDYLTETWMDGDFLFMITFTPKVKAQVGVDMYYGDKNYISALDYPLLVFYGILGLVYIVLGLVWLVMLACNWRDLLRVQFWIGGVILLGMLEKAVFFGEFENINKYGRSVWGAVIFAELVSCLKRTLARMLVIIVSLGFGIVKPRLGQAFHKVLFVGGLFFILAAIESCMRATQPKSSQSNEFLFAAVPLAVLDAIICWWIFSSLIQTTRTLRLRRNIVKLTLYRHFTNTLIFNVLASVAYMIWFMTQHKFRDCVRDWKQLWVDEAFWHLLFVVLLFIIMLLWRPNANNQRYAFSPLLDAADEEEEEEFNMSDAFDGMKMRGGKNANGSPNQKRDQKKRDAEDDLKWVEDNIPSSVADKALPALLDSDEEIMTTRFEMSKMD